MESFDGRDVIDGGDGDDRISSFSGSGRQRSAAGAGMTRSGRGARTASTAAQGMTGSSGELGQCRRGEGNDHLAFEVSHLPWSCPISSDAWIDLDRADMDDIEAYRVEREIWRS